MANCNKEEREIAQRHSAAHVLAAAVKRLYPRAKLGIGYARGEEFFYDFYGISVDKEALAKIEEEMKKIIREDLQFVKEEVSREKAKEIFREEVFKLELLEEIGEPITIYKLGDFIDLCKGPHVDRSGEVGAIKLLEVSAAYWKGDESREQMIRITGVCFSSEGELDRFLELREKIKEIDHRKIGKQHELFSFHDLLGPGLPIFGAGGNIMRKELIELMREMNERAGYLEVWTPHVFKADLWKKSGHYEAFKDKMFILEIEGEEYALKPMNCPGHCMIFKSKARSYKELPIKYAEFGTVYRLEKSGELKGLLRVRAITQDDGHVFCREDQVKKEVLQLIEISKKIYEIFGFEEAMFYLSTRPEKFIGDVETWEKATQALKEALEESKVKYEIREGEGAFYGPKIDVCVKDALGRKWQCTTIQLDFFMPARLGVWYLDEQGEKRNPVLIHRAILGSIERFVALLIEHFAYKLPVWLCPVQVVILPIADRHVPYAEQIEGELKEHEIRAEIRKEGTLESRIRDCQLEQVPYMIIVGDKEERDKKISVRKRTEEVKHGRRLERFIKELREKIEKRSLEI